MSYIISGVGQYNYVPTTALAPQYHLKQYFSEAIFSPTAEVLLLRKINTNTLYYAGKTDNPKDLLFWLNENMETTGIVLPQVIPVGNGTNNIFGYIRLAGKYPPTYPEAKFGLFYDMDLSDFPKLVEKGIESVLIDQFTNVVFTNDEGETGLIESSQIEIPSYTKQSIFIPGIITRLALKGEDKAVKIKQKKHNCGLKQLSFLF